MRPSCHALREDDTGETPFPLHETPGSQESTTPTMKKKGKKEKEQKMSNETKENYKIVEEEYCGGDKTGRIPHRLPFEFLSLMDARLPHEMFVPKSLSVLYLGMKKDYRPLSLP